MRMEENAFLHTIQNAIQAIGRGFDVNYDTRLLYCKEVAGSRLVEIDEECRDLRVHDRLCVPDVSRDIKCSSEAVGRELIGPYSFSEVWLIFNSISAFYFYYLLAGVNHCFCAPNHASPPYLKVQKVNPNRST